MKYTIHQIVTQLESNQYYADVVKNKKSILVFLLMTINLKSLHYQAFITHKFFFFQKTVCTCVFSSYNDITQHINK